MPNSIITAAGLALFADALYSGETITIDRLVFADVPGLDPAVTPDENQSLPPAGQIMLNAEISHSGKVDENTVVYSTILTANDGNFYINWIGLYSTEHETLVAVCVVPRHYKFKTDGFQAGNTLYKNFAIQYANAAALTGISINPETWQYDFDTRYALKDHNHDSRYEPLGAVNTHNNAASPHPGKFESAGAVSAHNTAADPHSGKFDVAGTAISVVNTHNSANSPHPGKFESAGAVSAHNSAASPHPGKFESAGAVSAHNSAASPHQGKFDAAGAATAAVNTHNNAASPHPGKFESAGAVSAHNSAASPHPGKFAAADHTHDLSGKANITLNNLNLSTALANLGFSGSIVENGYQKLPGGLIIQWGNLTGIATETLWEQRYLFPIAFPHQCLTVLAIPASGYQFDGIWILSFSTEEVLIGCNYTTNRDPMRVIAIGY